MAGQYVTGLRETVRSLERLGVAVADMKAVFSKIGKNVVSDAQHLAPHKTGRLAASIKASNTKNKSIVRAGNARVPYAGVQHYGGYNNISPHPYLTDAIQRNQSKTVQALEDGIGQLIRTYGLK